MVLFVSLCLRGSMASADARFPYLLCELCDLCVEDPTHPDFNIEDTESAEKGERRRSKVRRRKSKVENVTDWMSLEARTEP